jgi:hypothetical protein
MMKRIMKDLEMLKRDIGKLIQELSICFQIIFAALRESKLSQSDYEAIKQVLTDSDFRLMTVFTRSIRVKQNALRIVSHAVLKEEISYFLTPGGSATDCVLCSREIADGQPRYTTKWGHRPVHAQCAITLAAVVLSEKDPL